MFKSVNSVLEVVRLLKSPVPMKVTAAGRESLVLRRLVRQAIPILSEGVAPFG